MTHQATGNSASSLAASALTLLVLMGCGGGDATSSDDGIFVNEAVVTTPETVATASGGLTALPAAAYRAEWKTPVLPTDVRAGEVFQMDVSVTNVSEVVWPDPLTSGGSPPGAGAVRLGHRWWPASGQEPPPSTGYSDSRADLGAPVPSGGVADFRVALVAPKEPGTYKLEFDLVQEMVAWFRARGSRPLIIEIVVR